MHTTTKQTNTRITARNATRPIRARDLARTCVLLTLLGAPLVTMTGCLAAAAAGGAGVGYAVGHESGENHDHDADD